MISPILPFIKKHKILLIVFILISSLLTYWVSSFYASGRLGRVIEQQLKSGQQQVAIGTLFPRAWQRLCLIPTNYNQVSQAELDQLIGTKNLVSVEWLANDRYELYAVLYNPLPTVERYQGVHFVSTAAAECTRDRASLVGLGMDSHIPSLAVNFAERVLIEP